MRLRTVGRSGTKVRPVLISNGFPSTLRGPLPPCRFRPASFLQSALTHCQTLCKERSCVKRVFPPPREPKLPTPAIRHHQANLRLWNSSDNAARAPITAIWVAHAPRVASIQTARWSILRETPLSGWSLKCYTFRPSVVTTSILQSKFNILCASCSLLIRDRAHQDKHERCFLCDIPGCTNKTGFARIGQLNRHKQIVRHPGPH